MSTFLNGIRFHWLNGPAVVAPNASAWAAAWPPVLSLLAALLPLSFSSQLPGRAVPAALLFAVGLGLLASPAVRRSYAAARPVLVAALVMLGFIVANALVHHAGWRPLDRAGHILLFVVIAAVFARPLWMRMVWSGFALTAITLGGVCVVQHYANGIVRAYGLNGGPSASIQLATVLLGLGLLSLVQLFGSQTSRGERVLHGLALALAMYGALLTQSRGPLLGFLPMVALVLLWHGRRSGRWRMALLVAFGVGIGLALAVVALRGTMVHRFEAAQREVATFDPGDNTAGSVRERLEMWRVAGHALAAHPLLGIGPDRYRQFTHDQIVAGRSNPSIASFNQPHNEYLRAAADGGLPGLLVLLLLFALPLGYFMARTRDPDDAVAVPATAGAAITGLYVLCALTDSVFYRVMSESFFFFIVMAMALLIARPRAVPAAGG